MVLILKGFIFFLVLRIVLFKCNFIILVIIRFFVLFFLFNVIIFFILYLNCIGVLVILGGFMSFEGILVNFVLINLFIFFGYLVEDKFICCIIV